MDRESAYQCRRSGRHGSVPGVGRTHAGRNGNPSHYSCLENPMDTGAWGLHSMEWQRVRHNLVTEQQQQQQFIGPFMAG